MKKVEIIMTILMLMFVSIACGETDNKEVGQEIQVEVVDITGIDESKIVFEMSGKNDYAIYQNEDKHYLIYKTEDGELKQVLLGDRTGLYTDETKSNKTIITDVIETAYSDIVYTQYIYSGAITASNNEQVYINNDKAFVANMGTSNGLEVIENSMKYIPTFYLDNRVALLNDNIVKIFDDTTGEIIQEIDGVKLFGKQLNDIYEFENNGQIYNIQAVGEDFVVVNMLQPNTFMDDSSQILGEWYYTTVINLDTLEIIPVYEQLNSFKDRLVIIDGEMARPHVGFGIVPTDSVRFVEVDDGKLIFECKYGNVDKPAIETVVINYK